MKIINFQEIFQHDWIEQKSYNLEVDSTMKIEYINQLIDSSQNSLY